MGRKFNPKDWGLSKREEREFVTAPTLGPPTDRVKKVVEKYDAAWKAWDAAMVVADRDRTIADKVFDNVRKQEKKHGKDEGNPEG